MRFLFWLITLIVVPPGAPANIRNPYQCDDGWFRFQYSCYLYMDTKTSKYNAEFECELFHNAKLISINTVKEFETVFEFAPRDSFIWIGEWSRIFRNIDNIDWLNKPFSYEANGFTEHSCIAHYSSSVHLGKFSYFYSCRNSFNFICERNMTSYSDY